MLDTIRRVGADEVRRVGAAELSLREVAERAGISPAGLYRYVDGRDGLLELLIADGFDELSAVIRAAIADAGPGDRDRLWALVSSYRQWALAQPARFALILGSPLVRFEASAEGPTLPAARRFGAAMFEVFLDAFGRGTLAWPPGDPLVSVPGVPGGLQLPAGLLARVLRAWASLHGLVILELDDQLAWTGVDPEALLRAEADDLAESLGLPA